MNKIIVLLLVLFNAVPVFAYNSFYSQGSPNLTYYSGHNMNKNMYRGLNSRMNVLEKYAFNRTYGTENNIARLERLESLTFGSVQSGDIATRFKNVENAILNRSNNGYKTNLLNTISNYFIGQTTGITPSVIPYNGSFYPNYNNTYSNQYSNGIFNYGHNIFGNTYGSGSSVRILD